MELTFLNSAPVFIEINAGSLQAARGTETVDLPLARAADGTLTPACQEKVTAALEKFTGHKSWQPRVRAFCAIAASGIALRQGSLPAATGDEFQRLLLLKIETEFPLPPEELAWGWQTLPSNGPATTREILIAAVRKEIIAEYTTVLVAAGLRPVFTPAALARNTLCPPTTGPYAILEIGRTTSELVSGNNGVAESLRIVAWGAENAGAATGPAAKVFGPGWNGRKLFISGGAGTLTGAAAALRQHWNLVSEPLDVPAGRTAAMLGLEKSVAKHAELLLLGTSAKPSGRRFDLSGAETRLWLKRAVLLLAALTVFPYAEALLLKSHVAKKYAAARAEKERMAAVVDPELRFLQALKQTQPPYLEALFCFAKATPPGARLDPVAMNQRGELSWRAVFQNGQQVSDFRAKLNDGGFFTNVVVEEQAPTPDRQKVNVRMSARWNADALRTKLKTSPLPAGGETNSGRANPVPPAPPSKPATP